MLARERRQQQRNAVSLAYEELRGCVADKFDPGYFNSPNVLAAESAGLETCDAVLGHVVSSPPDPDAEARALELLNRVSRSLVPSEVENRCHDLHAACLLMLDALRIPVVLVWGSVYATDMQGHTFWLNAWSPREFPGHRPGHSWLLTHSWRVADVALVHQFGVAGDYDRVRHTLPTVITEGSAEASEPRVDWWRFADRYRLTAHQYAEATRYYEVIGWSRHTSGGTTVRYLPEAMSLPEEAEMDDVNIRIGGLSPRDFFELHGSDLVPD